MNRHKFLILVIAGIAALHPNAVNGSPKLWLSFHDAWGISGDRDRNTLRYSDIRRNFEIPLSIFCKSRLNAGNRVVCKVRINGIIDSAYFGIFCRAGNMQYDFLLTGTDTLKELATIQRTFNIGEILNRNRQPLTGNVVTDSLWHDWQFVLSERVISFMYDTVNIGAFSMPFVPAGEVPWGFSAFYCNIEVKDISLVKSDADTIRLPVNSGTVFSAPLFRGQTGSSDRILGY